MHIELRQSGFLLRNIEI